MEQQTKTKKALIMSVLSVFLCIAMLIGMTFAWFTDTASTGVNKIQAGTLDVALEMADGTNTDGSTKWVTAEGQTLEFVKAASAPTGEEILWEPGCTYKLPELRVVNKGNLALKYKVVITGITGDKKLAEVIDWECNDTAIASSENMVVCNDIPLLANENSEAFTISAHMQESAGNEYQGLSIDSIAITVYATQMRHESDSKDNTYDENAVYPVGSLTKFKEAIAVGGTVTVGKNITVSGADVNDLRTIITAPTTLNLDKKIISPDNMGNNEKNFAALYVDANTTINAGSNGGIDTGNKGAYAINVRNGATLTINGGYYYGGGTAVQVQEGTLIINSGTFACEPFDAPYGNKFLINCVDSAYRDGTAKVFIKGGTFVNFDPSNNAAEGAGTNFVAVGYKVVSETQLNGDVWYTVVAE